MRNKLVIIKQQNKCYEKAMCGHGIHENEEARLAARSRSQMKPSKHNILQNRMAIARLAKRRNTCDSHVRRGIGRTK